MLSLAEALSDIPEELYKKGIGDTHKVRRNSLLPTYRPIFTHRQYRLISLLILQSRITGSCSWDRRNFLREEVIYLK